MNRPLVRKRARILSPLRYPGGKRRLWGYIAEVLRLNRLRPKLFVEPFAGGASVALQLLAEDLVENIALADRDPFVASFWKIIFSDPEWLVDKVQKVRVTLRNWNRFRNGTWRSDRGRALACLFLNRTSFSGILALTAGPIGGRTQESDYKIDCRFPVETLVKRIRQAAELGDRVTLVKAAAWKATVEHVQGLGYGSKDVFFYFDPPFYAKADRLYRYCFEEQNHTGLHDSLVAIQQPWLLSYDVAEPILRTYSHNSRGPKRIDLLYSIMGSSGLAPSQELIITNLDKLPARTRLWRSSREWRAGSDD